MRVAQQVNSNGHFFDRLGFRAGWAWPGCVPESRLRDEPELWQSVAGWGCKSRLLVPVDYCQFAARQVSRIGWETHIYLSVCIVSFEPQNTIDSRLLKWEEEEEEDLLLLQVGSLKQTVA